METVKIRLIGDEVHAEELINMLHEMAGVEQVEALSPSTDGAGAMDASPAISNIEVGVADLRTAHQIRTFTAGAAILMDASAEFVEHF